MTLTTKQMAYFYYKVVACFFSSLDLSLPYSRGFLSVRIHTRNHGISFFVESPYLVKNKPSPRLLTYFKPLQIP